MNTQQVQMIWLTAITSNLPFSVSMFVLQKNPSYAFVIFYYVF